MKIDRASIPKIRALFLNFENGQGRPPPSSLLLRACDEEL